jgi:hypothetical protein
LARIGNPGFGKVNLAEGLTEEVSAWLGDLGWSSPQRVLGGRNNRIFKVTGDGGEAALKIYYRGEGDSRDRYAHEKAFYAVANTCGASAPRWLAGNDQLGVSLLEWVEGEPVPSPVGRDDVLAAAEFLNRINQEEFSSESAEMQASEARFTTSEHVPLLEARIDALQNGAKESRALLDFIASEIRPAAEHARSILLSNPSADFGRWSGGRIFSPGDFGLHNALRQVDGRTVFFDFEYSGWDDPVKTVADVFLQPEKPVDWDLLGEFCGELNSWSGLEARVRSWVPFYAAKWAVILMNSVAKDGAQRRVFAGDSTDEEALSRQIEKARGVLEHGGLLSQ